MNSARLASLCAALVIFLAITVRPRAEELFNGKDLRGWRSFLVDSKHDDPRRVFSVANGLLRISGDGLGYLATERTFTNYHLVVEFRWGRSNFSWGDRIGKARDSGVFLHATGPHGNSDDGAGAFMAAIECNIFQGATGDFLLIRGKDSSGKLIAPRLTANVAPEKDRDGWHTWQPDGEERIIERWGRINWKDKDPEWRDLLDFRGRNDIEKPGWNKLECVVRDGSIEVRLNGFLVNRARNVSPRFGKILLQCEGSEIFFRAVKLSPLD